MAIVYRLICVLRGLRSPWARFGIAPTSPRSFLAALVLHFSESFLKEIRLSLQNQQVCPEVSNGLQRIVVVLRQSCPNVTFRAFPPQTPTRQLGNNNPPPLGGVILEKTALFKNFGSEKILVEGRCSIKPRI